MKKTKSFKFLDADLHQQLLVLLTKSNVNYDVGKNGMIHYSSHDEEVVENEFISAIRDRAFPSWQVLTCPPEWTERYKEYMSRHGIPFREELSNGELWFVLPGKHRPHAWKLGEREHAGRIAM